MGMGVFQFVLALTVVMTVVGLTYQYMVERMKYKEDRRGRDETAEGSDMARRLAELEERVRVLERIVTDESSNLRDRFSDL